MKPSKQFFVIFLLLAALAVIPLTVLAASGWQMPAAKPVGGGQRIQGNGYALAGAIGQPESGRLTGGAYRLNGGVVGELDTGPRLLYLPLVVNRFAPPTEEVEPNNTFSQANMVGMIPATIRGTHDGDANTGDVFMLDDLVVAGDVLEATIQTSNSAGLQLIAYDPDGNEIARDYDDDHVISFIVPASGSYYIYVFTDPDANNTGRYELHIVLNP